MRCPSCYKPVSDDDRNCPHCGISLSMFNPPAGNPSAGPAYHGDAGYAGFWRRAGAYILDSLILGLGVLIVFIPLVGMKLVGEDSLKQANLGINLLSFVVSWLYFALQESSDAQATLGKRFFGMQVTDLDGNRLTFARATGRYFGKILSSFTLLIGFIMAGFTARKQALHDMVAGTLVVDRPGGAPRMGCAIVLALVLPIAFIGIILAIAIPAYQGYVNKAKAAREHSQPAGQPADQAGEPDAGSTGMPAGHGSPMATQADMAAEAVESSYARNGSMPTSLEEAQVKLDGADNAPIVTVGSGGTVTLFARNGKANLTMVPHAGGDGTVTWHCFAEGLAPGDLPTRCPPK